MDVEHRTSDLAALDVLERVLDKGVLLEADRVTPDAGLGRIATVARVRVVRAETLLHHDSSDSPAPRAA
jgi:hypothetical protein